MRFQTHAASTRLAAALTPILITALSINVARAGELAEAVPADALVHIEWFGGAAARDGGEPAVQFSKLLPSFAQFAEAGEKDIEQTRSIGEFLDSMWASQVSVTLVDLTMTDSGPDVQLAIIVRPADGMESFMKRIDTFIAEEQIEPATTTIGGVAFSSTTIFDLPMPTYWAAHKDHLIVALSPRAAEAVVRRMNGEGAALTANSEFVAVRKAMTHGDARFVLSGFVNVSAAIARAQQLGAAMMGAPSLPPIVERVIEEAGLNGVLSKGFQMTREGDRFRVAAYVHAPAPRKGLFRAWDQRPITEEDFAFVPADAYYMQACNWDLMATYQELLATLGRIDPGYPPMVNNVMNVPIGLLGIHPIDDVIAKFGDTWILFDAPDHGGVWFIGGVLVAEVEDPASLVESFERICQRVSAMPAVKENKYNAKLTIADVRCGGRDLQQIVLQGLPVPISLTWGVADGRLVMGLFPQTVAAALDQIDPATRRSSLVQSPAYRDARAMLPANAVSVGYSDNQAGLRLSYPIQMLLMQLASSFAGGRDIGMSAEGLHPLAHEIRRTHNSVGVTVVDEEGVLYAMTDPGVFGPGAFGTSTVATSLGSTAVAMSILLPSLQRARELSKRAVSAANLRGIGQACMIYANDNDDRFPPDLDTVVQGGFVTEIQLRAPTDDAWQPGGCSYVYVAGQSMASDPRNVLAYERPDVNDGEGANVLFVDGHVEFMRVDSINQVIRETYERLGRSEEVPDFAR